MGQNRIRISQEAAISRLKEGKKVSWSPGTNTWYRPVERVYRVSLWKGDNNDIYSFDSLPKAKEFMKAHAHIEKAEIKKYRDLRSTFPQKIWYYEYGCVVDEFEA